MNKGQRTFVRESSFAFQCLTRRVPRAQPMPAMRGIGKCTAEELGEWRINGWDQSPYQFLSKNKVISLRQPHMEPRRLIVDEERGRTNCRLDILRLCRNWTCRIWRCGKDASYFWVMHGTLVRLWFGCRCSCCRCWAVHALPAAHPFMLLQRRRFLLPLHWTTT